MTKKETLEKRKRQLVISMEILQIIKETDNIPVRLTVLVGLLVDSI